MSTILETKNLVIGYEKALLEPVNFNINKGELIGIIGKNGIGKSTLLKTLMRIISPLSGDILLENQNLSNLNTSELAQKLAVVLTEKISLIWQLMHRKFVLLQPGLRDSHLSRADYPSN